MNTSEFAKNLRRNQTLQEQKLWNILRDRKISNCKFRRQYKIDSYIVDFVCIQKKLIIEIDGSQHISDKNIEYDIQRTEYLEKKGYTVIRFWNSEIDNNIEGVYEKITEYISE